MTTTKTSCLAALTAILLTAGCSSPRQSESSELNRMMNAQMKMLRDQMQTSGATAQQLREFDRASAQMSKSMRQMDRQMRAMEQ